MLIPTEPYQDNSGFFLDFYFKLESFYEKLYFILPFLW